MLVYHGSIHKIEFPDVKFSKKYLDYGQGFYLTCCYTKSRHE